MPFTFPRPSAAVFSVALSVLLTACSTDVATNPTFDAPSLATSSTTPVLIYAKQNDPKLLAWLELEKLRIDAALNANQRAYDSLKVVYDKIQRMPSAVRPLLYCDPLQYVAVTKIVGPNGDDLDFGPHRLRIERGALNGYTVITAEAPASLHSTATFSPHGLNFQKETSLDLSFKHCTRPADLHKRIVYVNALGVILENIRSEEHDVAGIVRGWIRHFSSYMIAY